MAHQIYPIEFHLNKANFCDIGAPILNLHLSISNGIVVSKINDKGDDFDFDIENSHVWTTIPLVSLIKCIHLQAYSFR